MRLRMWVDGRSNILRRKYLKFLKPYAYLMSQRILALNPSIEANALTPSLNISSAETENV